MLLDRKSLLKKEDFSIVKVVLKDDDFVFVRQMSGRERDRYEASMLKEVQGPKGKEFKRTLDDFRAKLVCATTCDEKGDLLFQPGDVELLSQNMTAFTMEKIVEVAQKLNKITEDDKEEAVKN